MKFPFKKLLSYFNVIDVVLFALTISVIGGLVFFSRRDTQFITVRLKITDTDVLYALSRPRVEYSNSFRVGDLEKNELGQKIAEITRVESFNINETEKLVIIDVSTKAIYNPSKNQYSLKGRPFSYGTPMTFNFSGVRASGIVVDFPGYQSEHPIIEEKMIVKAQLRWENRTFSDTYGVPEHIARAISEGQSVQDSLGHILATITDVQVAPAKRTVQSATGSLHVVQDPILKDVFYTIELSTKKIDGKSYMFDYLPVQIGLTIPLNFESISVFPQIIEIQTSTL